MRLEEPGIDATIGGTESWNQAYRGKPRALHLDRVALLAIEQVHLLAADVSLLKKRGAHLVRRQNAKQMSWRPFGWRQIFSVVPGFQKSGHARMDWLHEFIGSPSEDGKGPLPLEPYNPSVNRAVLSPGEPMLSTE